MGPAPGWRAQRFQTYSQLSGKALANPKDTALAAQVLPKLATRTQPQPA